MPAHWLLLCLLIHAQPRAPEVSVAAGRLRGALAGEGGVFRGVPYARPPVGDLRWREPQPVEPWRGVRDAMQLSAACIQNPNGTDIFIAPLAARYGVHLQMRPVHVSEDCLYLNVWTPAWPMPKRAPVMVWFHGGSNLMGSAMESGYDGAALASHGVVVVTVNYRLGVFGFFAHPALTAESPHHASGNYGLLDQIAALEWVCDNIGAFGGDPGQVTVFGESAGAIDIGMLMASPLNRRLFQRAIVESGPPFGLDVPPPLHDGERFGKAVARAAGLSDANQTARQLRALPSAVLFRAGHAASVALPKGQTRPELVIDGWVLRDLPAHVFGSGKQAAVDLLIGFNARELSAFRQRSGEQRTAATDWTAIKNEVHPMYGGLTNIALAHYLPGILWDRTVGVDQAANDMLMACPSESAATIVRASGKHAYVYEFARSIPGSGQADLGAFHALELPFVFDKMTDPAWNWLTFTRTDRVLAEEIEAYWTNFAKTGNPNASGLPHWPEWSGAEEQYLEFDVAAHPVTRKNGAPAFCRQSVAGLRERLSGE